MFTQPYAKVVAETGEYALHRTRVCVPRGTPGKNVNSVSDINMFPNLCSFCDNRQRKVMPTSGILLYYDSDHCCCIGRTSA